MSAPRDEVWLRLLSVQRDPGAPEAESARVAARLREFLGAFGPLEIDENGPYWKAPEGDGLPQMLEFEVTTWPRGGVAPLVEALEACAPRGWFDPPPTRWEEHVGSCWSRQAWNADEVFVHPDIDCVSVFVRPEGRR